MAEPVKIVALCGSLRAGSFNRMALNAALLLAPEGVEIREAAIGDLPLYDGDVESKGYPPAVQVLREQMAWAEAFLIVSPEYNHSVPGGLKNAIDWASRGADQPFAGKVAAVTGASTGVIGTSRMQHHLRQVGVGMDLTFVNKPEVMIGQAQTKFDATGALIDETTGIFLAKLLTALRDHALKMRG